MSRAEFPHLCFVASLLAASCAAPEPEMILEAPKPGVTAKPLWLTYTCVEPGCETTRITNVRVVGTRDVAIKRVVLSDRDRDDFSIELDRETPFILEVGETFDLRATYRPTGDPRLLDVEVLVAFTDASADEDDDRVTPGELAIPLVRRLIGEPILAVEPTQLVFGAVPEMARKTLPLTIMNGGFGNVGVVVESVTSNNPEITVGELPEYAVLPDAVFELPVTYAPRDEKYTEGLITVRSADATAKPALVGVLATSIPRPTIAVIPDGGVEFGEIPVGMNGMTTLEIANQGADILEIFAAEVIGGGGENLAIALPRGASTATIASLSSIVATLSIAGVSPGVIDAQVQLRTNDRANRNFLVPVRGLVTQPQVAVRPTNIDFGLVPRGWSVTRRIEIENVGYGELELADIHMVMGSANLYALQQLPNSPTTLRHQERASFVVEYRAEAEATFNGRVGLSTNDPDNAFVEVPLTAVGASCDVGCPIANGTPSCAGGECAIGMCDVGWYDTDSSAATGCECAEVGRDPGAFCADGHWAGSLKDKDGDSATFTGILAVDGDVDTITFFAEDATNFFGDDFDVRVRLESSDPTIEMCVYRHNTGQHEGTCLLENERCGRSFRRDGSVGPDDSGDYIVKIKRRAGAPATCSSYTVFMRNG